MAKDGGGPLANWSLPGLLGRLTMQGHRKKGCIGLIIYASLVPDHRIVDTHLDQLKHALALDCPQQVTHAVKSQADSNPRHPWLNIRSCKKSYANSDDCSFCHLVVGVLQKLCGAFRHNNMGRLEHQRS